MRAVRLAVLSTLSALVVAVVLNGPARAGPVRVDRSDGRIGDREEPRSDRLSSDPGEGEWIEVAFPPPAPDGRLAHDELRNRAILLDEGLRVWSLPLDGQPRWSRLSTLGTPPPSLREYSLIHDPPGDRLLLFGGRTGVAAETNDVWELTLGASPTWSLLAPPGDRPPPRRWHSSVYDPVGRRMVVFGGYATGHALNDTWSLSLDPGPEWSPLEASGTPPEPRFQHLAAFDAARGRMLVFAGEARDDTWGLGLGEAPRWMKLATSGAGPGLLTWRSAVYDPVGDRLVVLGTSASRAHTWALSFGGDGGGWSPLGTNGTPPGPLGVIGVHDPLGNRLITFGGGVHFPDAEYPSNTTRALDLGGIPRWEPLAPTPPARSGHRMVYDSARDRMLLAGGVLNIPDVWPGYEQAAAYDQTVWALAVDDAQWRTLTPIVDRRERWSLIYDPPRDRLVGAGGMRLTGFGCHPQHDLAREYGADAWSLSLDGSRYPVALPRFRPSEGHSAVLDPVRDRMISFGGVTLTWECLGDPHDVLAHWDYSNEVRALTLSGAPSWTTMEASGDTPSPREGHSAIYDPPRDRMVVFGGRTEAGLLADLWALSFSGNPAWTLLTPQGSSPPPMEHHSAIYDPVRDRMVVFGGSVSGELGWIENRSWELSLPDLTWRQLAPTGTPPPARSRHSAVYDPVRDHMIIFGGEARGDHRWLDVRNDVWVLHWGDPVQEVSIDVRPGDRDNHLNPASRGVLPVAVRSAGGFDATSVDPETVTLNTARVARRGNGDPQVFTRDVDSDGLLDLFLHFPVSDLVFTDGDRDLWLDGRTREGKRIRGRDRVTFVGNANMGADVEGTADAALAGRLHVEVLRNPARGARIEFSYSLTGDSPAVLDLVDVQGRVVARGDIHAPVPGVGTAHWDPGRSLAGGVYFLRLRQGDGTAVARIVVLP